MSEHLAVCEGFLRDVVCDSCHGTGKTPVRDKYWRVIREGTEHVTVLGKTKTLREALDILNAIPEESGFKQQVALVSPNGEVLR